MNDQIPEVGPWAREKLQALGDYLRFYTTALKNQGHWVRSVTYVDAFAGSGQARVRRAYPSGMDDLLAAAGTAPLDADAEQYVRGSPRVALDIPNRFSHYVFIERSPGRAAELEQLRTEYGEVFIDVRQGTAQQEIGALLRGDLGKPGHLGVVFLDPFGMQVPWNTVQSLAVTGRIEIIINFALGMAIQRVLARSADIAPGWREALDRLFGTPDWFGAVYESRSDLLGITMRKREDAGLRLLEWYRRRLKDSFGHVSPAKLIRNTQGGHLYYLIWAGPNALGLKGAHAVLSKGESVR